MRTPVAVLLTTSLATLPIAGCGTAVPANPTVPVAEQAYGPSRVATARLPGVTRAIVQTPQGPAIAWACEGETILLPSLPGESGPVREELVIAISLLAADMLVAGARAWALYALTHRGDAFDREACAKVVIQAMLAEAALAVPVVGGGLAHLLVPVVMDWITRSGAWPWQLDLKRILQTSVPAYRAVWEALRAALAKGSHP
jgi:hypothetical protein